MKKKIFICSISIFLTGCNHTSLDVKEMDRVRGKYIEKQQKKHNFIIEGLGAAMFDKIREIIVYFISAEKLELNEARSLFVATVEELVEEVNDDIRIRQYLNNYPFNFNNAKVHLSFIESNRKLVAPPYIAFIFCVNGIVYYCQNNPVTDVFIDFHQEPYEEALQIVREQNGLNVEYCY